MNYPELLLEITDYIEAPVSVDQRGLGLSLIEAYQHLDKNNEAMHILGGLWDNNPSDKVMREYKVEAEFTDYG